jgi:hypothetical protein
MTVQVIAEIKGLENVEQLLGKTGLQAKTKKQVVQRALIKAARPLVNVAASRFRRLGGSNSLATSMKAYRVRKGGSRRTFASVEVGPKRGDKRALAAYFRHYGKTPTPRRLQLGIRHGHLVEFGSENNEVARRILENTARSQFRNVVNGFNKNIGKEIDAAVRKHRLKTGQR